MTNAIIAVILIVIFAYAVKGSIRHFKGEGGCCGGGSGTGKRPKPKKKKLDGPVVGTSIIRISGMHCQNCVNSVTGALNRIDGVSAKVDLKEGCAAVSYDRAVDEADLKHAVEDAGFTVVSISHAG
ncbi:heavy-metal-associated domain-containing protein [Ruminococcus sp. CLA-AA-H200]|uniref:Heavy-metal-associated domain-containing protein n=1 Tax=Ruminococcus turbiniformis TaxID=2881258 RepID=A0ABS8FWW4_9FIRM|nr:heavy metal-associated domain-containing protein [Ruminococcus turbiniformis]MCC2253843.1 heavy-metal-associated domain-containing protein [Ruminococcus turbiniformis]